MPRRFPSGLWVVILSPIALCLIRNTIRSFVSLLRGFCYFMELFLAEDLSRSLFLPFGGVYGLSVHYGISSLLSDDTMEERFYLFRFCDLGLYGRVMVLYSVNILD